MGIGLHATIGNKDFIHSGGDRVTSLFKWNEGTGFPKMNIICMLANTIMAYSLQLEVA